MTHEGHDVEELDPGPTLLRRALCRTCGTWLLTTKASIERIVLDVKLGEAINPSASPDRA